MPLEDRSGPLPKPMLPLVALASSSPIVRKEFVFEKAPFRQCHASTIVQSGGGLVAAWFGGDREGARNVDVYVSRKSPGGDWSPPRRAATGAGLPCYNPVLFQPANGPLMLFFKIMPPSRRWYGLLTTSTDGGQRWSPPERLPAGIIGPVKNKPIALADGTLLCGSSEDGDGWQVHFERTTDLGKTWTRTPNLNDPKSIEAIQPSLLPLGGDRIRAVGRTKQSRMFAIDSQDDGRTWGPMRLTDVPNSNSGIDATRLADGRFLLVYDDATKGRTPLRLAVSSDAEHWKNALTLESGPGEYSYPAIIQASDGLVHITYTWKRQRIRHVVINPARL